MRVQAIGTVTGLVIAADLVGLAVRRAATRRVQAIGTVTGLVIAADLVGLAVGRAATRRVQAIGTVTGLVIAAELVGLAVGATSRATVIREAGTICTTAVAKRAVRIAGARTLHRHALKEPHLFSVIDDTTVSLIRSGSTKISALFGVHQHAEAVGGGDGMPEHGAAHAETNAHAVTVPSQRIAVVLGVVHALCIVRALQTGDASAGDRFASSAHILLARVTRSRAVRVSVARGWATLTARIVQAIGTVARLFRLADIVVAARGRALAARIVQAVTTFARLVRVTNAIVIAILRVTARLTLTVRAGAVLKVLADVIGDAAVMRTRWQAGALNALVDTCGSPFSAAVGRGLVATVSASNVVVAHPLALVLGQTRGKVSHRGTVAVLLLWANAQHTARVAYVAAGTLSKRV